MSSVATTGTARRGSLRRVDQFVPSFAKHDAIGNHVLQLRRILLGAGFESEIFYEHLDPRLAGQARPYLECNPAPDPSRLIVYHASTHSVMSEWLIAAAKGGQAVALDYHNITPSVYFARWEPQATRSMDRARGELADLVPWADLAVADSGYNESELIALGHPRTGVAPLLLDLAEYHAPPDEVTVSRLRARSGEGPLWLFVGRVAPNKCQHDVIAAFAVYNKLFAPGSRLVLIGSPTSARYMQALQAMIFALDLGDKVQLAGSLAFPELLAHFRCADVFVCLSEHEGFCVPIIEAMELGVAVVAYRAAAVTDTVAGAGVLLDDKDPLRVALAVHRLLDDPGRCAELVAAGRDRAETFALDLTSKVWLEELARYGAASAPAGAAIGAGAPGPAAGAPTP